MNMKVNKKVVIVWAVLVIVAAVVVYHFFFQKPFGVRRRPLDPSNIE